MATVLTWGFLGSLAVLGFAHQIKILGGGAPGTRRTASKAESGASLVTWPTPACLIKRGPTQRCVLVGAGGQRLGVQPSRTHPNPQPGRLARPQGRAQTPTVQHSFQEQLTWMIGDHTG